MQSDESARYRLLYDLGCAFAARIDLDELLPLVLAKCRETLDAEAAAVLLHDPERDELDFSYVSDEAPDVAARLVPLRFPANQGIAGAVLASGRSQRVDDAPTDARFYPGVDQVTGLQTRTLLAVPLCAREGVIGVIQVVNRRGAARFADDDLAFLEALTGSITVAFENARLYARLKAGEERLRTQVGALRRDLARRDRFAEMIGTGVAMAEVFRLMDSAAASPISVIIEGETGTGKELVARGIHRASGRAEGPFLAVNCAALPETLLESELFGHRRGAFTGATQDRRGLFEAASGGTIFLDEVGEMPLAMQAKLLRVLEERQVLPVGENAPRKVDVRVIAATNRDLHGEVGRGTFREDLYYRLAAFPIRLPPLRDRPEDIPLLADRVLAAAAESHRKRIPGIEPAAVACLMGFSWPGNVRELHNEIERAVALARDRETIGLAHLSAKLTGVAAAGPGTLAAPAAVPLADGVDALRLDAAAPMRAAGPLRRARAAFEASYIAEALRQCGGNVSRTARELGLSRVMLQKKMKEYDLR